MEVHILCSAGKGIGIGHLSRMKVVYHEIRRKFKCEVFLHILDDSQNTTTYDNIILSYIPLRQSLDFYLNNLIYFNISSLVSFALLITGSAFMPARLARNVSNTSWTTEIHARSTVVTAEKKASTLQWI
jgi:spore coat polysaccharide biosynthesis predicted glycosyltransferase SpsG